MRVVIHNPEMEPLTVMDVPDWAIDQLGAKHDGEMLVRHVPPMSLHLWTGTECTASQKIAFSESLVSLNIVRQDGRRGYALQVAGQLARDLLHDPIGVSDPMPYQFAMNALRKALTNKV